MVLSGSSASAGKAQIKIIPIAHKKLIIYESQFELFLDTLGMHCLDNRSKTNSNFSTAAWRRRNLLQVRITHDMNLSNHLL